MRRLNTCVGRRNYLQFFLLSLVGAPPARACASAPRTHVCRLLCTRRALHAGTLLYLYQGVFTLLIMLGWGTVLPGVFALVRVPPLRARTANSSDANLGARLCVRRHCAAPQVALGAHVALITATFLSFVTLFGFHVYLLYLGKGTYDWLLDRRDISEPSQSPRSPPLQSRSPLSPTDDRLQRARAEWAAKHGDDVDVEYGVELTSTQRPPRPRPPHKPHDAHGDADVEAGTQRALDTPDNMGDLYVERQEREETESVSALAPASEAGSEPWQDDLSVGAEDGEGVGEAAAAPAAASGDVAGAGAAAAETEGAAAAAAAGVTAAAADAVTAENVAVADSRAGQDAEAEAGGEAEYVTVDLDTRAPDGAPSNASTNGDRAAADPAPAPESVQAEVVDSAATAGRSTESS